MELTPRPLNTNGFNGHDPEVVHWLDTMLFRLGLTIVQASDSYERWLAARDAYLEAMDMLHGLGLGICEAHIAASRRMALSGCYHS